MLNHHNEKKLPEVIFVTAYDSYALKAFEVQALDYLLKPFEDERFFQSLERAKERVRQQNGEHNGENNRNNIDSRGDENKESKNLYSERLKQLLEQEDAKDKRLKRMLVKKGDRINLLDMDNVQWIEASGIMQRFTRVRTHTLYAKQWVTWKNGWTRKHFIRIHRSTIVNITQIKEFQAYFKGDYIVILKNGEKLT